jgi:hypothetical protein
MTDPYESLDSAVIVDCDGKEVGEVLEVHRDAFSGRPAWVAVKGGLLHGKSLVPVGDAVPVDGKLQVPYDSATIKKAPYVDLSAEQEAVDEEAERAGDDESIEQREKRANDHWQLYEYYGVPFGRPDTTGAASPEAEFGFGSAGTSPEAEGAAATPEEIVAEHPEAASAYPEGTLDDDTLAAAGTASGESVGRHRATGTSTATGTDPDVTTTGGATRADLADTPADPR